MDVERGGLKEDLEKVRFEWGIFFFFSFFWLLVIERMEDRSRLRSFSCDVLVEFDVPDLVVF